ncbi:uncharacterized protein B0T15DRAFT_492173 [Chaetomium strumarium]|uniref:Uncharacterized protein n=1 Tax=Chaetomium strumarium TaxID=1170767 RepID=A0AAJ0GVA0_9PEZI|nr:hypothetical protein B0T15DRAFT_492173 [Chaetomium strumarium]
MSLLQAYKNLTPKSKAAFGAFLLAWGVLGLQFADKAEAKLGLTPSEADKAALERVKPRVVVVPKVGDGEK